jgi:hypothetical protein
MTPGATAPQTFPADQTLPADQAVAGPGAAGPGVAVLGMHRSGTSLVTAILSDLGGRLCREDDLLHGTERGQHVAYGESRSMVLFNESLLRAFGGDWAVPPVLEPGWWTSPRAGELARAAAGVFGRVHPHAGWLCKDPRLCLTLPFWQAWAIPRARAVLVVRHPDEVAASLERRDGIGAEHARSLWQLYMSSAVRACQELPTLVVSYDQLCRDPFGTGELLQTWASPGAGRPDPAVVRRAVAMVRSKPAPATPRGQLYDLLANLHGRCLGPVAPAAVRLEA